MISFIVPAYNEEVLIADCIRSIKALGLPSYELIVVDNGSTDRTGDVAWEMGARVLPEPHKGVTRARQAGFEVASGDILAFVDADNILPKSWLRAALSALSDPRVVVASGPIIYPGLPSWKQLLTSLFYGVARLTHLIWPMVQGGNFIVKRSALVQAGGFNTSIEFYGEDTDTAVRLSKVGRVVLCPDMWSWSSPRRMHEEGLFITGARYVVNYAWVSLFGHPWSDHYNDIRPD